MELRDPGVFLILAVCNDKVKAKDVEKEILSVLKDLKKGKIKQEELEKVKINTKADFHLTALQVRLIYSVLILQKVT
jgi:predicted Zn-dependent peptidase